MKNVEYCDYLIIGAGVVGLAIARQILVEKPTSRVIVIEKETSVGLHASGRNSGVLHAGFYYSPDSLKASLTRDGNALLKEFLTEKGVPVRNCGKVVVANSGSQIEALHTLHQRGVANNVDVSLVTKHELAELEPEAFTTQEALWSPTTSVSDPNLAIKAFQDDVVSRGAKIIFDTKFAGVSDNIVETHTGQYHAGHVINCAGLYADKVAKHFGFATQYVLLPFKGLYWYSSRKPGFLQRHVYPVPDSRNPFLGVHATVTVDGRFKIGPTAIPVLSRENYQGIQSIVPSELGSIAKRLPQLLGSKHHSGIELLTTELPKYKKSVLVNQAKKLVPGLTVNEFETSGKSGIRAQLFNIEQSRLEMDFVVEGDSRSTHILNAVSPAWTSCISFAQKVVRTIGI